MASSAAAEPSMPAVPRVNASMLAGFKGKLVTLVGRVESITGSTLTLEAADRVPVTVNLLADSPLVTGSRPTDFVEIVGQVAETGAVDEKLLAFLPAGGQPFDLDTYNEFVKLSTEKFSAMFA